ncbi:hypothetical protein [Burkholderia sp. Ac-20353]|uniref:hypothetical protein n=1 Tax=Burkholderia sp. Ac-20353 TaxID=2703894 RepID=UPI00197C6916|nr:hypothetical protein [Burkholderia sp. Ac-20353]
MQNSNQALRDLALGPQHNRLVQLASVDNDAPYKILLPNAFDATESLSKDFAYSLEILPDNAQLAPNEFIGKPSLAGYRLFGRSW